MDITYYVSEDTYKYVVATVTKRLLLYSEIFVHIFSFSAWTIDYQISKHKYTSSFIPLLGTAFLIIVFSIIIHFLFQKVKPIMFIRKIV
ncbi:hypothetical protein BW425_24620 [Bacillus pseudomycoides]|uniref:Uncharacterized protein n=1 Tax=Bacillus pseudomycoides TaxID=64104 RepID=A0A1Y3MBN7_9BACI|nr:hypothetical protein BW425_24620 [Bacillus pseudomycoides]PEK68159.1 hypothetical protein CN590_13200 [Bacillus pseudomycoides]PEL17563.1 hypothetical protein CN608_26560 [Bacillus pseudomycoides]PGE76158.1 hypothetical protein COM55_27765 [Bacillus pseudomycoides]